MTPISVLHRKANGYRIYQFIYNFVYNITFSFNQLGFIFVSNTMEKGFYFKLDCAIREQQG